MEAQIPSPSNSTRGGRNFRKRARADQPAVTLARRDPPATFPSLRPTPLVFVNAEGDFPLVGLVVRLQPLVIRNVFVPVR
jgi:hypothetical protein